MGPHSLPGKGNTPGAGGAGDKPRRKEDTCVTTPRATGWGKTRGEPNSSRIHKLAGF